MNSLTKFTYNGQSLYLQKRVINNKESTPTQCLALQFINCNFLADSHKKLMKWGNYFHCFIGQSHSLTLHESHNWQMISTGLKLSSAWLPKLFNYTTAATSQVLPDSCQTSNKYGLDYMELTVEMYYQKKIREHRMLDNSQLTASHLWYNEEIMNLSVK